MALRLSTADPDTRTERERTRGGCSDCQVWSSCKFDNPRNGGFKGSAQGPRYVVVDLITDRVENSNAMQTCVMCDNFVSGGLQDRMISGQIAAAQGRPGAEIVRLRPNAKTWKCGTTMGFNGKGEIIKPQSNQVEELKAAGYTVNLTDIGPAVEWREVEFERSVPEYRRPTRTISDYSLATRKRIEDDMRREMEDEDRRFEERDQERRKPGRPRKPRPEDDEEFALEEDTPGA